jgi:hypothetical protein
MFSQFSNYLLLMEKSFFVLSAVLYLFFAFIIVRQTTMMSKNVYDKFNAILVTFSYLHFAFSIFLVILTLLIL